MRVAIAATTKNRPYTPHPRDFIQIDEGTPYTVPVDKIFVLTSLGQEFQGASVPPSPFVIGPLAYLYVNGERYLGGANIGTFNIPSPPALTQYEMFPAWSQTPALVFRENTLLEVRYFASSYPNGVSNFGRGTGYLVNAGLGS